MRTKDERSNTSCDEAHFVRDRASPQNLQSVFMSKGAQQNSIIAINYGCVKIYMLHNRTICWFDHVLASKHGHAMHLDRPTTRYRMLQCAASTGTIVLG